MALQDAHLANQARFGDEGYVIAAGPFTDPDDERLRGVAVLSVGPEEARRLYESDPTVRAGRVSFEHVKRPRSTAEAPAES